MLMKATVEGLNQLVKIAFDLLDASNYIWGEPISKEVTMTPKQVKRLKDIGSEIDASLKRATTGELESIEIYDEGQAYRASLYRERAEILAD